MARGPSGASSADEICCRGVRCTLLLSTLLLACGCDKLTGGAKPADVAPLHAEDDALKQSETDLLSQRGALQRERKKLSDARTELVDRRKQLGHDSTGQSAIDDEEKKILDQELDLQKREDEVNDKLAALLKQREDLVQKATQVVATAPGADPLERAAKREQVVAQREKDVAAREKDVAEREHTLADREAKEARREKETCGAAAQLAPLELPKGLKYSAHDVEPIYKKALKLMQEKGLLSDDLPPSSARLVGEVRESMKKGDFVRAKYDADALLAAVDDVHVDRTFISAKMARLAAAMKGHKLEGDRRKTVESLFQEATADYGDGKFPQANNRINSLFGLLK